MIPRILAPLALLAFVTACSDPGGGVSYFPPQDTVGSDATLNPDVLFPTPDTVAPPADTEAPIDTLPPADTLPPVDTLEPVDGGCTVGDPCDDGDACTISDRCIAGGFCAGTRLTCDDNVDCTVDSCADGVCAHTPPSGQCFIEGACVPDGEVRATNSCQRCSAADHATGWSSADGVACDDGDPCTEGEQCSGGACTGGTTPAEVCGDSLDNDCNGRTDDQDVACGAAEPCTFHTDCYPERVCGYWTALDATVCSDPCVSSANCPAGHFCAKVPGSMQIGYCQEKVPGRFLNGAPCAQDDQCQSGLCNGVCMDLCLSEAVCTAANNTCQAVGDLQAGVIMGACGPNPSGTLNNGLQCADSEGWNPGLCASGHCDLMDLALQAFQGQEFTGPANCKALCRSELDCAPADECNIVLYTGTEHPWTVPFDPQFQQATHDTLAACYAPLYTGGQSVGTACSQNSQCSSAKCIALIPGDPTGYCTSYCEFDQECPSGMACKQDVLTITSQYLVVGSQGLPGVVQDPAPGAYTYVRICKFE